MSSNENKNPYKLSEEQNRAIYKKKVEDKALWRATSSVEHPQAILIAGQPGAGKSNVVRRSIGDLNFNTAEIALDDYRQFHPQESEIYSKYGRNTGVFTHEDAADWAKQAKDAAIQNRYNVVMEGTMKTPDNAMSVISEFKEKGYDVTVRVVAVNELESRQGIFTRYEEQMLDKDVIPRFTPVKYHDDACPGVLKSIERIDQEKSCRLQIFTRNGEMVFDSANPSLQKGRSAIEVMQEVRNRPWDVEKFQDYVKRNEKVIGQMTKRGDDPQLIKTVQEMNKSAEKMLSTQERQIYSKIQSLNNEPNHSVRKYLNAESLYNSYAKEAMTQTDGIWKKGVTDNQVAQQMLKDGFTTFRTQEVIGKSPSFAGMQTNEITQQTYKIVKEASKVPDVAKVLTKGLQRGV